MMYCHVCVHTNGSKKLTLEMTLSFEEQLARARLQAELERTTSSCNSSTSSKDTLSCDMKQLQQYADEAGVYIYFTNDKYLAIQCARARYKHEKEEIRKQRQVRTAMKLSVCNVVFGLGVTK